MGSGGRNRYFFYPMPNLLQKPKQLLLLLPAQSPSRRPFLTLSLAPPLPVVSYSSRPPLHPQVEKIRWLPLWRDMLCRARRWEKPA